MATTHQAIVNINCWKQIECVGCGGTYRYKFVRRVSGTSNKSAQAAEKTAKEVAVATIEVGVEQRPCPWCGCYQSDMVGQAKDKQHFFLSLALLVVSAVVIGFGFAPSATLVTYSAAARVVGGVSVLGLLLHAAIAFGNPNKEKAANRNVAARMIVRGQMKAVAKADADLAEGEPRVRSGAAVPLLSLAVVAALATFTPAVQKLAGGWPTTTGAKPEVVCPGDTVRMWFPDKVEAVQGLWHGVPRSAGVCDGRPMYVQTDTSTKLWGYTIRGKNVSNSTTHLWADLTMPSDPTLVGKVVEVTVDLDVQYPSDVGGGFDDKKTKARHTELYTLAPPGTSASYSQMYWLVPGGSLVFTAAGFMLGVAAVRLRRFAPPATVVPADAPKSEDSPPTPATDTPSAGDRPGRL